ncbi:uncharacterized protein [Euphorbia lathyris]|uniref:uncharacterized protein n=1 Tax=Euphorbia lathyris TaxID=212925 RepID=UPI003313F3F5
MEEAQNENSNPPIRRKSHLKSQTYFTLVRILSHCANHPQLCRPAQIDHQEPRPDNSSNEVGDASEEEVHKYNELVGPPGMDQDSFLAQGHLPTNESVKAIGVQDGGFTDTHSVIDEIENIMNIDEEDDQNNLTVNYTNGTGLQGEGFGNLKQLLMDELEHAMKGNEEVARDNNSEGNEEVARDNNSKGNEEVARDNNSEGNEEVARDNDPEGNEEVARDNNPEGNEEVARDNNPEGNEEAARDNNSEGNEEVARDNNPEGNEEVARDNNSEGNEEVARDNNSGGNEEVARDNNSGGNEEVARANNSGGKEEVARDNNSGGKEEVARDNNSEGKEEGARDNNSKGNEEVARDNNSNLTTGGNQCGGGAVAFSDSQGYFDLQSIVMLECSNDGQQQVDKERSSDNNEDIISLIINNEIGSNIATQEIEMDFQKPVHAIGAVSFSNHMTEGNGMEEGEISAEFEVSDKSVMSYGDAAVPQEQRKQLSEDVDRNKLPSSEKEEVNRKDFVKATTKEKVEANDVKKEMVCKRKIVVYEDSILAEETHRHKRQKKDRETKEPRKGNGDKGKKQSNVDSQIVCSDNSVSSIQSSDQTTGDKKIMSKDKDAGENNKKKHGPPSEQKKAKKKEKKRKLRAQKNRELGVKRLKLRPVQKPKPISYCRHYINGRCHEGEKCKFSHDTVPLTKSKPCGHFARNSCMKGDDCPFDHQLSKYPCNNYASTGYCSRGEGCLFSHKIPLKEDLPSTSNVSTPDLKKTSLPGMSSSKKQLDSSGTSLPSSKASPGTRGFISCKNTVQNVAKSVLSPTVLAPKGISFLSAGKSPISESIDSTPSSSSVRKNERFEDGNKADQSTSEKTLSSNDMPKGTQPSIAPKGINFLSFGKAPLEFSSSKNLTGNSGSKLPFLNNFGLQKQPNPTLGNAGQVGNDATRGVSGTASRLNIMLQKNEFAAAQTKSNILSHGESSTYGSRSKTQSGLFSSSVKSVDRNVRASEIPGNVHQSPRIISQELQASSLTSSQSANYLANSWLKDAPNSAQKALMSTLAFAGKVESEMKMKQSTSGALAVSSKAINKETGDRDSGNPISSKNDSVKALKILDFLSSISGKKRQ